MAIDKKLVDKLTDKLNDLSEDSAEDLREILEKLNTELQTANVVVSLKEKNHLNDLNTTLYAFCDNKLPAVISKSMIAFFNREKENVSEISKFHAFDINSFLYRQIKTSYRSHIVKSLDNIPHLFAQSTYVLQKLGSTDISTSIQKSLDQISNQVFILMKNNIKLTDSPDNIATIKTLSKHSEQIKSLVIKLEEVLDASKRLCKTTSDVTNNILKHHFQSNSVSFKLSQTCLMFANVSASLILQRQGLNHLRSFYCEYENFQKYKTELTTSSPDIIEKTITATKDFSKCLLNLKTKLPESQYTELHEILGKEVNKFLKKLELNPETKVHIEF